MPVKIKTIKSYYITEASVELPASAAEIDSLMKSIKATGKVVSVYNEGGTLGINIEQKTKIPDSVSSQIKELLGIETRDL